MSLAETQRRLWRLVTAPAGVAQALREESVEANAPLADLIQGDPRADAAARLDVYANAYFYRVHGALESDYPALARALGDDAFHDVVTSYLLVHPPTEPSLRYAGELLAGFLGEHEAATGVRERSPWAADLARFEWAMIDAFDAANCDALSRARVAARPPEEFAELALGLRPDVHLLELAWPVAGVRTAHDAEQSLALPREPEAERMLVWRPAERVRYREVGETEALVLPALAGGTSFADLCERLAAAGDEEAAPALAAGLLERWLADEILIDAA